MSTGDSSPERKRDPLIWQRIRRLWPWAIVALGVALTTVWMSGLIYGVVKLIEIAI
jgi:hypothetical protein